MVNIKIHLDSIEINGRMFREQRPLEELVEALGNCDVNIVRSLAIDGKPGREFIELGALGLVANRYVPENIVTNISVRFLPSHKISGNSFSGMIYIDPDTALSKGAKVKSLFKTVFCFEHQMALTSGVAMRYEPKFEFIETLVIEFPQRRRNEVTKAR